MKTILLSTIKVCLFLVLGLTSTINVSIASTTMKVIITTGGNDLRGNGNPLIRFTDDLRTKTWLRM